jgi:heme a synthase
LPLRGVRSRSGFFFTRFELRSFVERISHSPWLARFAWLTALATWGLVGIGGLVTSKGVGMAVPDWPTSFGYNMFALDLSLWLTGGVFDEHTHRLWATLVGVLVVALTRWLGGYESRKPLIGIGLVEIIAGLGLLALGPNWKGAGHFLMGIGGVVLLAGFVWTRNRRLPGPLPALGWAAFFLVQIQGLLGGLRVVLDAHILADVRLGTAFGILHGCLGQIFLVLVCVIAVFVSKWWLTTVAGRNRESARQFDNPTQPAMNAARGWVFFATGVIFLQLMLGAAMRHQHAGLAVPDFPLAHGQLYPATDPESIHKYNVWRIDHREFNPVTAAQIHLHMVHRFTGLGLLILVPYAAWRFRRAARGLQTTGGGLANVWTGLVLVQAGLGILTVIQNKPADIATAHVMVGAACLVTGAVLSLVAAEFSIATAKTVMQSPAHSLASPAPQTQT